MTYTEADTLRGDIMAFLAACGGVYAEYSRIVEERVINSLASGQYLMTRDGQGHINHYLCYWKIHPEDVPDVLDGGTPADIYTGSILFVAEHGNISGMSGMRQAIKELRQRSQGMRGLIYNHAGEGYRIFSRQKGA